MLADLKREQDELKSDPMVVHYDHPDIDTMRQLVTMGHAYRGSWYHSYVIFSTTDEPTPEAQLLRAEIERLGNAGGFYLIYQWEPESLTAVLEREALEQLYAAS